MSTTPSESDLQAAIDRVVQAAYASVGEVPPSNATVVVAGQTLGEYSG
jgi:hypothetical protein